MTPYEKFLSMLPDYCLAEETNLGHTVTGRDGEKVYIRDAGFPSITSGRITVTFDDCSTKGHGSIFLMQNGNHKAAVSFY